MAKADQQDVLKAWEDWDIIHEPETYIKHQTIVNELNGSYLTYESLQTLSGIGPYCAAAIASISFKVPVQLLMEMLFVCLLDFGYF